MRAKITYLDEHGQPQHALLLAGSRHATGYYRIGSVVWCRQRGRWTVYGLAWQWPMRLERK